MRKFYWLTAVVIIALSAASLAKKVLTLPECINTALKNNWTYRSAVWSNKSAGNDLWSAWGNFLPRVDLSFSNNSLVFGPSSPIIDAQGIPRPGTAAFEVKSYSAGFQVSQVFFDGGAKIYILYAN